MSLRRRPRRTVAAIVPPLAAAVLVLAGALLSAPPGHVRANWAPAGALPAVQNGRIWQIAIDPNQPSTVLAATDRGLYRSTDGARSFGQTSLNAARVWSVGFDAAIPHIAYAGLNGGGAMRSDDAGGHWQDVSAGLPSRSVRSLAFANGLVAAGTGDGVAVTVDGKTWRSAGLRGFDVSALRIDSVTHPGGPPQNVLIAGTDSGPNGLPDNFLFANAGPGPQWKALALPPHQAVVSSIAVGPRPATTQRSAVLVATNLGLYRNDDPLAASATWTQVYPGEAAEDKTQTVTSVAFSPVDPNLAYAGDDAGGSSGGKLLRSTDGGLTFTNADEGLPAGQHNVVALAIAPASPPLVVVGVNPVGKGGTVWAQTDASVPPPAATAPPEAGAAPPNVGPLPSFTPLPATPPPAATPAPAPSGLRRAVSWPFPLSLEIFVLLLGSYGVVRWYQRRLDIEGPP